MAARITIFARAGVFLRKYEYSCRQATAGLWHRQLISARYRVLSAVNLIRTFLSCFIFYSHPADSNMRRFSLQFAAFVFSTHPLHIPGRIDKGELPGVVV